MDPLADSPPSDQCIVLSKGGDQAQRGREERREAQALPATPGFSCSEGHMLLSGWMERHRHEGFPAQPGSATLDPVTPSGLRICPQEICYLPRGNAPSWLRRPITWVPVPSTISQLCYLAWPSVFSSVNWGQWENLYPNKIAR